MNFIETYLRFNIHGILGIIAGGLNLFLGILVYTKNSKSKLNFSFFLFTVSATIWTVGFAMYSLVQDTNAATFWWRLSYFFGVPFIPINIFYFCISLRGMTRHKLLIPGYLLAFLLMLPWQFFPDLIGTPHDFSWGRYPIISINAVSLTVLSLLFSYFGFYISISIRYFFLYFREEKSSHLYAQKRNIFIGFIIAYLGAFDFVCFSLGRFYPFGYISLALFNCIVSYNIIKHQFLDIKIVIKKISIIILIYALLILLIIPIGLPIVNDLAKSQESISLIKLLLFSLFIGLVFSFGPFIYAYIVRHNFWLRGHMTTGLTHELKSPINAIQSSIELIYSQIKNLEGDKTKILSYLNMIDKNSIRLESFTKDLLALSNIQEGNVSIDKHKYNLEEILKPLQMSQKPIADKKGIKLSFNFNGIDNVIVDKAKFQQIISNLISNAIKFTKDGLISVEFKKSNNQIIGIVKDTGIGINTSEIEKIFDRFYHGKASSKGSGIGLSIAKAWVEAHGGKIWAESEGEGKGTKVSFNLPI